MQRQDTLADLWQVSSEKSGNSNRIISEAHCLELIDAVFPHASLHLPYGRGDDCAELAINSPLALSTDFFWLDQHFRTSYFTPQEAGAKALTVAVSDLAGAGARPLGFSLGLMLPPAISSHTVNALLQGLHSVAQQHDLTLTGGDISCGNTMGFCITVWGESITPSIPFFLRRGVATVGDTIFLVGKAGLARAGFLLLEREGRSAITQHPLPCLAHLAPAAHIKAGMALAKFAFAQQKNPQNARIGLMDLSDGIMRDLPRLLTPLHNQKENKQVHAPTPKENKKRLVLERQSGKKATIPPAGAALSFPPSLFNAELCAAAEALACDPTELILTGGEDYALLGTCPAELWEELCTHLPDITCIGTATAESGITCQGKPVQTVGFDHFS